MQFISNIRFWLFIFDKTEWQSNCRKRNCPSNATRHVGYRWNLSFEPKSFIMLRVFIDSKKPIAFAFNLRFYLATLFWKGLISCLPVRTAQAQPKLFVRLRVACWNVNIRNVVIKRKPANGSSLGEEPKSLPGGRGYSHTLLPYIKYVCQKRFY